MNRWNEDLENVLQAILGIDLKTLSEDSPIPIKRSELVEFINCQTSSSATSSKNSDPRFEMDHGYFFQQLIDSLPDYIYFKDRESRFIFCNPAHLRHLGASHFSQVQGKSDLDFFQKPYATKKVEDEAKIIQTGKGWFFREEHHLQQDGTEHWALSSKLPLYDRDGIICGIFGISRDITEKKITEIELEKQRRLLQTIIKILPCRLFVRDREGKFLLINDEYKRQLKVEKISDVVGKSLKECFPGDNTSDLEEEDRTVLDKGISIHNKIGFDTSPLTNKSWISTSKVPLKNKEGQIEGLVGITMDITEQKEAEHKAKEAYSALSTRTEQMETELDIARNLQERLMSEGFQRDHSFHAQGKRWVLHSGYLYQASHHLAGDFFHLIPISKSKIGILVCDVMGHGVKAALVTMLIRGILNETFPFVDKPEKVLAHLNNRLVEFAQDPQFPRFTTAIYLVMDLTRGFLRYAIAGHPEPIFIKDAKSVLPIEKNLMGCALGLIPNENYPLANLKLHEFDRIALFSDGILEATNSEGDLFDRQRLTESLLKIPTKDILQEMKDLERSIQSFTGKNQLDDDVCLLILDVLPHNPN